MDTARSPGSSREDQIMIKSLCKQTTVFLLVWGVLIAAYTIAETIG